MKKISGCLSLGFLLCATRLVAAPRLLSLNLSQVNTAAGAVKATDSSVTRILLQAGITLTGLTPGSALYVVNSGLAYPGGKLLPTPDGGENYLAQRAADFNGKSMPNPPLHRWTLEFHRPVIAAPRLGSSSSIRSTFPSTSTNVRC